MRSCPRRFRCVWTRGGEHRSSTSVCANIRGRIAANDLLDTHPPPERYLTSPFTGYSLGIYWLVMSGALDTRARRYDRGFREAADSPLCLLCGLHNDDERGVFSTCASPKIVGFRNSARDALRLRLLKAGTRAELTLASATSLSMLADKLFVDGEHWPDQGHTLFFYGRVPRFEHLLTMDSGLARDRLAYSVAADCFTASIRLVGRIWGERQRACFRDRNA